ncbi:hypothetical protein [Corynebacterium sp.]|uniref:hypothetical protein n=1 Tax=Corynebacterium sp. TaxID=1720 RepID=UPI0026DC2EAB|nr:hypothetical protein [Corynebacterium sp.]MDO5031194.1 hypothetical protein [Corynebacterium sp.]
MKPQSLALGLGLSSAAIVVVGLPSADYVWMLRISLLTSILWISAFFITRKEH